MRPADEPDPELRRYKEFELLTAELLLQFVEVPSTEVETAIGVAQRRVCEHLHLDLSSLWQWMPGSRHDMRLTHDYRPGGLPLPEKASAEEIFPWFRRQTLELGRSCAFSALEELPPEAARDRATYIVKHSKRMMTMRKWTTFATALILALAASGASAQPAGLTHTIEAYFMGASMSGTTGAGPVSGDVDLTSSKIFENLQFGAMADYRGEAPKWAVAADIVYMGLGATGTGDGGRATAEVDMDEWLVEATGSYRFSPVFEVVGGARYTSLKTAIELRGPTGTTSTSAKADWVDPIVGARLALPLSKAFDFAVRGMFGGFGVGCDSTWDVDARVKWHASKSVVLSVGYRYLDQDYEKDGGFKWDVVSQGPLAGAALTF